VTLNGASALILGYSRLGKIQAYTSLEAIYEARKNIILKLGEIGYNRFLHYLKFADIFLTVPPRIEDITLCEQYIDKKDAPILAAAIKSQAMYIITLDRKHFLQSKVIQFTKPKIILTPGEFVSYHFDQSDIK
jgi:predicted nucleic acid-binding protein